MGKVHRYEGEHVDVTWDGRLCIHVAECGRSEGGLFEGGRQPWCQPDVVDPDVVGEIVRRCPSGALVVHPKDGSPGEEAAPVNVIVVSSRGPLYVRGDLDIEAAADDMPGVRFRAALCRCGQSKNKPFCDNSHEAAGFADRGPVGETGPGTGGETGPLTVRAATNGPLLVAGPVEIVASTGQTRWRGTKAALCRCGGSKNKPFCDGTHRKNGFEG